MGGFSASHFLFVTAVAIQKLLGRLQKLLKRFAWNADASANVNRGDAAIFDKAVGGVAANAEDGSDFFNR